LITFGYFFELANFEKLEPHLKDLKLAQLGVWLKMSDH